MKIIDLTELKDRTSATSDYLSALEKFLPIWVESLIPHYEEARRKDVELLSLSNYLCLGTPATLYEFDGIGYYLHENKALGGMELAFNSGYNYQKVGWNECFEMQYPDLCNDETKRCHNFCSMSSYMSRISNTKAPYDIVAKQVDDYFKQLISHDSSVGLSLGTKSFIYLTDKAKNYINRDHYID